MLRPLASLAALLAAENPPESPAGGCTDGGPIFFQIAIMFAIFFFIVIVPARKEKKQHQAMLDALKRGDEVLTSSGILGTITDLVDPFVTLEIARNVKIRVLRSSIAKKHVEMKKAETEKKAEQA
jgi:preprotein translocase subunit YajC